MQTALAHSVMARSEFALVSDVCESCLYVGQTQGFDDSDDELASSVVRDVQRVSLFSAFARGLVFVCFLVVFLVRFDCCASGSPAGLICIAGGTFLVCAAQSAMMTMDGDDVSHVTSPEVSQVD